MVPDAHWSHKHTPQNATVCCFQVLGCPMEMATHALHPSKFIFVCGPSENARYFIGRLDVFRFLVLKV